MGGGGGGGIGAVMGGGRQEWFHDFRCLSEEESHDLVCDLRITGCNIVQEARQLITRALNKHALHKPCST